MKLGITESFQDHSTWQTFKGILGCILKELRNYNQKLFLCPPKN